jgi:hypothetical protein
MQPTNEKWINGEKKKKIYLSNNELYSEWLVCIQKGECTLKMIKYFEKLAKEYSTVFDYINISDKRAVINYAVAEAWQKWNKFNPEVTMNCFAFFTQMIKNDMMIHYNELTKGKGRNISIESLFTNKE